MNSSAIILIFAHKPYLEWYEDISLRQCFGVLHKHPIRLVCPDGVDASAYKRIAPTIEIDFIPPRWLASLRAYNRLKIHPFLYERYAEFEFMLTYELDAFVFKDELEYWCDQGWDYIGAPWFEGYDKATSNARPTGAGNSGFSLRRIKTMLRVTRRWRYQEPASKVVGAWLRGERSLKSMAASLTFRNNFFAPFNDYGGHEDIFWCQVAARRFSELRVAPYEIARRFSFEANPSRLFRESGETLPFGCHKWMTYEPEFWKTHIQPFGFTFLAPEYIKPT